MKKSFILFVFLLTAIFITVPAWAIGIEPQIVSAPDPVLGSQAVRFEVGDEYDDYSLMLQEFGAPLNFADYDKIDVSFDIYRSTDEPWLQNLFWGWTLDGQVLTSGTPVGGVQYYNGSTSFSATIPFYPARTGDDTTAIITENYVNLSLEWDLENFVARSWYNGAAVNPSTPYPIDGLTTFDGWGIFLYHSAPTGADIDHFAWIDNLIITGTTSSEVTLYDSNGFEDLYFYTGSLAGQDGWSATGGNNPRAIPEPATLFLFLIGMAGVFLRKRG